MSSYRRIPLTLILSPGGERLGERKRRRKYE